VVERSCWVEKRRAAQAEKSTAAALSIIGTLNLIHAHVTARAGADTHLAPGGMNGGEVRVSSEGRRVGFILLLHHK